MRISVQMHFSVRRWWLLRLFRISSLGGSGRIREEHRVLDDLGLNEGNEYLVQITGAD